MENELKAMLRERAEEARIETGITRTVLRRARWRRARTVALTGLVIAAVAAGSAIGVQSLNREAPLVPRGAGGWQAIWPQDTREEGLEAQEAVDARLAEGWDCTDDPQISCLQDDVLWQLDAEEVALRYALQVFGWRRASGLDTSQPEPPPDSPGPLTVSVEDCPPSAFCDPHYTGQVTLGRLLRPDRTGVWFVTAARETATQSGAEAFLFNFMEAREVRSASLMMDLLSPDAADDYETGRLSLNAAEDVTLRYEILDVRPMAGSNYAARVSVVYGPGRKVIERIFVGPGRTLRGDTAPLVVLAAETVPEQMAQLPSSEEIERLVRAFMDARMGDNGAEDFLSAYAAGQYERHEKVWYPDEEGLYLYGAQGAEGYPGYYVNWRFRHPGIFPTATATACDLKFTPGTCQDAFEVVVEIKIGHHPVLHPSTIAETLFVGRDEIGDLVIRAAMHGVEP